MCPNMVGRCVKQYRKNLEGTFCGIFEANFLTNEFIQILKNINLRTGLSNPKYLEEHVLMSQNS
jgi:hypothetical protein